MEGKVHDELTKNNPWYVHEQLSNLQNPHQIRTIAQRWEFFKKVINKQKKAKPGGTLRILDAGCGDGINLRFLSGIPDVQIFACDYNPIRIQRAKETFPDVTISQQDLTQLQMDENAFDVILCSQVLEHIAEDFLVLNEFRRILDPDGVLILGVPNEGCLMAKLRNYVLEPHIRKTTDHVHSYVKKLLLKKFTQTGYVIQDILYQGFFFPKQRINNFFAGRDWGFQFMQMLSKVFPSQTAGFYFSLRIKG